MAYTIVSSSISPAGGAFVHFRSKTSVDHHHPRLSAVRSSSAPVSRGWGILACGQRPTGDSHLALSLRGDSIKMAQEASPLTAHWAGRLLGVDPCMFIWMRNHRDGPSFQGRPRPGRHQARQSDQRLSVPMYFMGHGVIGRNTRDLEPSYAHLWLPHPYVRGSPSGSHHGASIVFRGSPRRPR